MSLLTRGILLARVRSAASMLAVRPLQPACAAGCSPRSMSTAAHRRVNRASRQLESTTISDPFPFDNPAADPFIILRNAIALNNYPAVAKAFRLCTLDLKRCAALPESDIITVLNMAAAPDVEQTAKDIGILFQSVIDCFSDIDRKIPLGVQPALVRLNGKRGRISVAVREANAVLSAGVDVDAKLKQDTFDALIYVLSEADLPEAAARLLERSANASAENFAAVIKGFASKGAMDQALVTYQKMLESGTQATPAILEALIDGFAAKGLISSAFKYFNELKSRNLPQRSAAYTAMIRVHTVRGNVGDAVDFYRRMREAGVEATADAYAYLIQAHGKQGDIAGAIRFLHKKELVKGFRFSSSMYAAMIGAYAHVGQMDLAWRMLGQALNNPVHDVALSTPMLAPLAKDIADKHPAYLKDMLRISGIKADTHQDVVVGLMEALVVDPHIRNAVAALSIYKMLGTEFLPSASPNRNAHSFAVVAHVSLGDMESAEQIMEAVKESGTRTLPAAHLALIEGYANKGDKLAAEKAVDAMDASGYVPDAAVYNAAIKACGDDEKTIRNLATMAADVGFVPNSKHTHFANALKRIGAKTIVDRL
ncbi:hypothetical protein DFJ77DRAFT_370366 [Powellomyces hirtus]|nr:hypothetical protein DFJ77DRAFT_370366 [Powellomyces hirtus]